MVITGNFFLRVFARLSVALLLATCARAELIQRLTSANTSSVTVGAGGLVQSWIDQSGKGNHAASATGAVIYPAANALATGVAGLQFGPPLKTLRLLDAAATAGLLDFSGAGAASAKSGFTLLIAARVDQLSGTTEPSDVLGVTTVNTAGGLGLRYTSAGRVIAYLGGVIVQRPEADRRVAAGDTVVFALHYNAVTGRFALWDSLNASEVVATIPKGNFAGSALPLLLGGMGNTGRFLAGSVGEVRLYDEALPAADLAAARAALQDAWVRRPLQHLDASVAGSVIGNPVTQWSDLSGSANHATAFAGAVNFPAATTFAAGKPGVQFGPPAKSLQLLNATGAAGLLNFAGAASANTGFSALVSLRVDALSSATEPSDILGVTSVNTAGGFGLRFNSAGQLVTYFGGAVVTRPSGDRRVAAGSTVIIGVNYDAATGALTLWDSLSETEFAATIAKGNFAGSGLPLTLGSMGNSARFLSGSVGEVKLFSSRLTAAEFATQREALAAKWLGARPVFPVMPAKPVFTVAELLAWNPAVDPDAPFNVATVPLRPRFNVFPALKANANARSSQGGVQALDTYAGNRPQGGSGSVYTFTYWQYLEESVYWGGISAINIVPPTAEMIDNAHRNGVPILGTIFFPPLVYGGNYAWVQNFLNKVGDTYPAADKLIAMARYYGFDGWFINQETEGGTAADAAAMRDLIRYIRQNSSIRVTWYDSMTEAGNIQWQDHLNSNNDWYLRHNYSTGLQNNTGEPIAQSMFVDFADFAGVNSEFPTVPGAPLTAFTRNYALSLGVDPYEIFTGVEAEAEDFRASTAIRLNLDKIFPPGQNHLTSVGIYKPLKYATQLSDQDLFWTGASGDPRNTSATVGTGNWRGLAHYIAERSVINTLPFATDFNLGRGANYYEDGVVVRPGVWWNRGLQSVLPTWRWIIDSPGTKLVPELWEGDAFRGGGSLRVSGNLDAENTLRLYLTDLAVGADTRLKIVFKRPGLSGVDSLMQVGGSFAAAPASFTFYPAGACAVNGWNETVIDLGAQAGKRIAAIALRFASATPVPAYEIRVGQLAIYNATAPAPQPPANIQPLDVVGWNGIASGRVRWDHAPGERQGYHVYLRLADGSLVFAGATVSNWFYFENIPIGANYQSVVVQTIGADARESALSGANTPPTLSAIGDRAIPSGGATGAIAFTVGDAETDAAALVLTRASSNPSLVPAGNIVFGGGGASRTVSVTPVAGLAGTATITLTADDGALTASESFVLTVTPNFLSWATGNGLSGPAAADTADPDGDGSPNLLEYALGADPRVSSSASALVSGTVVAYAKGAEAIANRDVAWTIETSPTLAVDSWTVRVAHAAGDPAPAIAYDLATGGLARNFVRLRVTRAP